MKRVRLLCLSLALILLALSGCAESAATPTATPPPPTSTPVPAPAAAEAVLDVNGTAMTMADLKALPQVEVSVDGTSYAGVRILDLWAAAGAADVAFISIVGRDGYAAEVAVADLDDQSILAFGEGTLNSVIPGQSKGSWVRDTVSLQPGSGEQEDAGGADVAEEAVLTVCGKPLTLPDLQGLEEVQVEAEGAAYTGVRILDLLATAAGGAVESVSLIASDGYAADVAVADLDEQSILAFDADGTFDTVLVGQSKGGWVRDTVEIACTFAQVEDAVLTANGKPFTMADLQALEQVEIEVEGTAYTGVRLLDLIAAAGISGEGTLSLLASDGYAGSVDTASLTDECILAYNDEGGVNTVLPGIDRGAWVKYVIQIDFGPSQTSTEPVPTVKPVEPGNSITVVDSLGNEVAIPKQVTRVASMRSGITEIICALGQKDKIVAVDEMVKAGGGYGAFITAVHPDLMDLAAPFAGGDINAEEMLRLAPDLVLHGGYGRIKQAEALMKQVPELPVVIAHFETIENYMADIRIVAQCVDAEDRADTLIAYLQGMLDLVQSRVKDISPDDKVRVFYGGHDIYHAYTPETFEHAQIDLAGGVNVAQELVGWLPEVSPEQLLVWDPEVIVVLNGVDVEAILNDPKVAGVSAIENKRVYALPEAGWDFSSPRALFCIEWLAARLYPELFADVDIEAEADAFYQAVFGVDYQGPSLAD